MVAILHRHAEIGVGTEEEFPERAYKAKNGETYKKLLGLDVNNLYGCAMKDYLPTGTGFELIPVEGGFGIKSMLQNKKGGKVQGVSKESVEWMDYVQFNDPRFRSSDGSYYQIQIYLYKGEKQVGKYFCDG